MPSVSKMDTTELVCVRVANARGLKFGTFASSYALRREALPSVRSIGLDEEELMTILNRFNEAIANYWPCHAVYCFGLCCAPCTLGLSLLCPNLCVTKSEEAAKRYLEQVSLNSMWYDRHIRFRLVKTWFSSSVEVSFPRHLVMKVD